ncbi:hypothetical protein SFUMM280S_11214 [Streptomyces fumanus]
MGVLGQAALPDGDADPAEVRAVLAGQGVLPGPGVLAGLGEDALGDAEAELGGDQASGGGGQPGERRLGALVGGERAEHGVLGDRYGVEVDAAVAGQALPEGVPVVAADHARVGGVDEDGQGFAGVGAGGADREPVGDPGAADAALTAVQQEAAPGGRGQAQRRFVGGEAPAPAPLAGRGLPGHPVGEVGAGEEAGRPGQDVVTAEELADRAVGGGDLADDGVRRAPVGPSPAVLGGDQQGQQSGLAQLGDLVERELAGLVAGDGVGGEVVGHLAGDVQPAGAALPLVRDRVHRRHVPFLASGGTGARDGTCTPSGHVFHPAHPEHPESTLSYESGRDNRHTGPGAVDSAAGVDYRPSAARSAAGRRRSHRLVAQGAGLSCSVNTGTDDHTGAPHGRARPLRRPPTPGPSTGRCGGPAGPPADRATGRSWAGRRGRSRIRSPPRRRGPSGPAPWRRCRCR